MSSASSSPTAAPATSPVWHTAAADEALLLQAALVGSSRPFELPPHADSNDAVAVLLRQVHQQAAQTRHNDSGNHLLRLAGVLGWCKRAGHIAPERHSDAKAIGTPPPEIRPVAPPVWTGLLQQALNLEHPRLHTELLQGMNQMQYRVPTDNLPALLTLGRQTVAMRPYIQPVLGERGRWLGGINRDWAWAQGVEEHADLETLWAHGSLEQRLQVLTAQRRNDPHAARERLMAVWSSLPAKERHALLETLGLGLNADDEAFLETQLQKDRASDVRRTAANLLAALPHSAYAQRMVQRLIPLVQVEKNKLHIEAPPEPLAVKDAKGQAVGTHPTHLPTEAEAKTDWPDAERSQYDTLGPRAWLLLQFVRRSSLSWWTAHTGLSPAELLKQAKATDWTEALIRGWLHASTYQPDPDWLLALLQHPKARQWGNVQEMLSRLSPDQRDQYQLNEWSADVASTDEKKLHKQAAHLSDFLKSGLEQIPSHVIWSERLSAYVAQVLQTAIEDKRLLKEVVQNYSFRNLLPEVACALHPSHLAVLQHLPSSDDEAAVGLSNYLRTLNHIVTLRLKLHQQLAPTTGC